MSNPDRTLFTIECGTHEIVDKYTYDNQSEKFVFLQGTYYEFAEAVIKLSKNVSSKCLAEEAVATSIMTLRIILE